jgi:hypothetical protein
LIDKASHTFNNSGIYKRQPPQHQNKTKQRKKLSTVIVATHAVPNGGVVVVGSALSVVESQK